MGKVIACWTSPGQKHWSFNLFVGKIIGKTTANYYRFLNLKGDFKGEIPSPKSRYLTRFRNMLWGSMLFFSPSAIFHGQFPHNNKKHGANHLFNLELKKSPVNHDLFTFFKFTRKCIPQKSSKNC